MQQIMQVLASLQDSKASLADRRAAIAKLMGMCVWMKMRRGEERG
jgi:hypothetical protein